MRGARLRGRVGPWDLMLLLYAAVFARQCFWGVANDWAAWALTAAVTALAGFLHFRWRPAEEETTPRVFWLIVALPLLYVYAMRAPIPDTSFDVLNHRLVQAERALRGPQLLAGDFFPTIFPFNPAPDMLTGLFRRALGYRLGTLVNFLALLWAAAVTEKILRAFVGRPAVRCACVLLAVFVEHALFEVNNYMVDLLALPLLLEAFRLALDYRESKTRGRDLLFAALLLGMACGFKLTNVTAAAAIALVFAARLFSERPRGKTLALAALACALFVLPMLPHAVYIWRETGSPVFPLYNNVIRSPLWPTIAIRDGRWGPNDLGETLAWPLLSWWVPRRLSELQVYSGRLTLGFLAALLCLVLPRAGSRVRLIALAALVSSLLWGATSGYVRYATFSEILGGILLVCIARYVWERAGKLPRPLRAPVAALPLALLLAQCVLAESYVRQTEWSGRPTFFDSWESWRRESRWVLRDRDLMKFQPNENRELFSRVDAWVVSGIKSNGVEVLLRPEVPMLGIVHVEHFQRPQSRRLYASAVERLHGKRVYSLTIPEEFDASLTALRRRGFAVGEIKHMQVPFFSGRTVMRAALIEVSPAPAHQTDRRGPADPDVSAAGGPLEMDAFVAEVRVEGAPQTLKPGQKATLRVFVRNASGYVWRSRGRAGDGLYQLNAASIWLASDGETIVNNTDARVNVPRDLWPGDGAEVSLTVTAPKGPGEYVLEIDLVQEGASFFGEQGSATWRGRVKVE